MSNGIPAHELRSLDNDDLVAKLKESKEELFNLRFQSATGQLTNNRRLRTVRARILPASTPCCVSASSAWLLHPPKVMQHE